MMRRRIRQLLCGDLRKSKVLLIISIWIVLVCVGCLTMRIAIKVFKTPEVYHAERDLKHYRHSRSLKYFLDNIKLLIEPARHPCIEKEVLILALVASYITRIDHRNVIRNTWGRHFPTFFVLGLDGTRTQHDQLTEIEIEAKQFGDMIVYDLEDKYQNLTLKTALMLNWTLERCPQARFLYKVDDDQLVNPWLMLEIIKTKPDAKLIGWVYNKSNLIREEYHKWYLPRWLLPSDLIPHFIAGPGYLISGPHVANILNAAYRVPIHNIEDIYFTYNVANYTLGYELIHEQRMSPYRLYTYMPLLLFDNQYRFCMYWSYASVHALKLQEVLQFWSYIEKTSEKYERGETVCYFYSEYLARFVWLYYV